jgi:hypothetical protein
VAIMDQCGLQQTASVLLPVYNHYVTHLVCGTSAIYLLMRETIQRIESFDGKMVRVTGLTGRSASSPTAPPVCTTIYSSSVRPANTMGLVGCIDEWRSNGPRFLVWTSHADGGLMVYDTQQTCMGVEQSFAHVDIDIVTLIVATDTSSFFTIHGS